MTLTLDQAKMEVWNTEDELVAAVPSEAVIKRSGRLEVSRVLFECGEPGRYYWPGAVHLEINPQTDSGAVLGAIHDRWASRAEWKVTWLDQGPERYQLDLMRSDGLHVSIVNLKDNAGLQVNSFSPCFDLAEYDPNKSY